MLVFNVKLTQEELKALAVFNPKFKYILDAWNDFDHFFNTRMCAMGGLLRFLSSDKHNPTEHLKKCAMLHCEIDQLLDENVLKQISEFKFDIHGYTAFVSALRGIRDTVRALLFEEEYATDEWARVFLDKMRLELNETMEKVKC